LVEKKLAAEDKSRQGEANNQQLASLLVSHFLTCEDVLHVCKASAAGRLAHHFPKAYRQPHNARTVPQRREIPEAMYCRGKGVESIRAPAL
jgi:hypothetical protein